MKCLETLMILACHMYISTGAEYVLADEEFPNQGTTKDEFFFSPLTSAPNNSLLTHSEFMLLFPLIRISCFLFSSLNPFLHLSGRVDSPCCKGRPRLWPSSCPGRL